MNNKLTRVQMENIIMYQKKHPIWTSILNLVATLFALVLIACVILVPVALVIWAIRTIFRI